MAKQPALRKPTDANYDDLLIDFSNSTPAQTEQTEAQEEPGFWEKAWNSAGAIAEGLTMLPGGIWDTVVDTWNGDDIDVTDREAIEARRQRENEKQAYLRKWDGKAWNGVAGAMVSMPYSLGTMGAALGAGVAGMAAGPVAAGAAGMAASGAMAYRATKHDFMQRLLDTSEQTLGRELTQDEWNNIANEFEAEATKYGAWEAIPETVGNMLFIKLLGPLGKKFMQEGIAKTAGRFVGAHAEEQVTESATQYGQGAIDADMGWRDKAPTLWEAAKEQAPMTFWQTTLMGGGKKAADYVYNRIKGRSEEVADNAEPETQNATANKEAADFGPLDTFFDNAYGPTSEADAAWYEAQARQQANLRPVPQYDQGNPEAAYVRAQAAHETANRFTAGQLGSQLEAKGNTRKEIYDFARGLLDLGYTDAQVEQFGEWWANDIYNIPGNPLEGFRLAGLDDDNIRGFLDQLLPANSAQTSGGVQAAVNAIQAQAAPQTASQATPQPATQAQHNSDNPLARYDPQIVEHYRNQGFSDEDIADFLPNTSQGQQTAAQINSGQTVDLLVPEWEQPAGIAGAVVQQSANDLDVLAEQWAAEPEAQGNQASIPANNVQPAGGVAGAVMQQDPVQQLPAQPIAQPALMPTQSQITNTQDAPRADTLAASNALGIPAPEALPQEAQPVQAQPAIQQTAQQSQATQQNPQDFIDSHIIVGSAPVLGGGDQAKIAAAQNSLTVRTGIKQEIEGVPPETDARSNDPDDKPMEAGHKPRQTESKETKPSAEEAPKSETTQDKAEQGEKPLEHWSRGALLAELGDGKEHRKASKPELIKAVRELWQKRERKPLGKNRDGETIYIDGYGVRHLDPKNYISGQPAPEKGQNWDDADGLYRRGEDGRRFLTAEEIAERDGAAATNESSEAQDTSAQWDGKENPKEFLTREIEPFVADAYGRNDLSLQDTISEANRVVDSNNLPLSPEDVAGVVESAIYGEIYDRVMAEAKKGGANLRDRLNAIYRRHPDGLDARKLNSLRKFIASVDNSEQPDSTNADNMAIEATQGQERENDDSGQTGAGTGNTQGNRVGVSQRDGSNGRSVSGETNTGASENLDGGIPEQVAGEVGRGNRRDGGGTGGKLERGPRGAEENSGQSGEKQGSITPSEREESAELAERQGHMGAGSGRRGKPSRRDLGGDGGDTGEHGIVSGLGGQESEVKAGAKNYHAPLGALERKGSWKETAARNLDIIELSKKLEAENREATPEEQALMAQYTGWGPSEIRNNLFRAGYGSTKREINPYAAPQDWRPLAERAKELLTQEEVETAFQSTQYAHYTSETMIRSIWKALEQLGFNGGKILEPGMGTGLFAVAAPAEIMDKSRYTGVEMDKSTARIARYILPESDIVNADFTKKKLPNNFFDLAIGNPPFADIKILNDPAYKKYRFTLHDYFFAKALDKVRPGGLLVFVTSKGTMDKQNDKARAFMAEKADLIGAIRLPQTAFKKNAGTEVVTDVLFLRKREENEQPAGESWLGLEEVNTPEREILINEYFANHPEMVLGRHSLQGSMYSANEYTVLPLDGNIDDHFAQAVERLPRDIYKPAQHTRSNEQKTVERDFDPKQKKEGAVYVDDQGILRRVEDGSGVALTEVKKLSPKSLEWIKDYVAVKEALKHAQYDQLNDGEWEKSLKELNRIYDEFVKKHGFINDYDETETSAINADGEEETKVARRFKHAQKLNLDIESPLVNQLEKIDKDGKIIKGPFMLGRTIQKPKVPEIHNTNDALMVSLDSRGSLDIDHVAELAKKSRKEVIRDLGELIYEAPGTGWQMADEYLSGDVVSKLEEAETAAKNDKRFERNVKALEKVQPQRLEARNITVSLGAPWIPTTYLDQFAEEKLGIYLPGKITYNKDAGTYFVPGSDSRSNRRSSSEYGTPRRSPHEILSSILNNQSIKVTDTDPETRKTYTDQEGTAQANEKAKLMREAFEAWIWQDGERARYLVDMYNRNFNNIAPRRFDGSHLTLPGLSLRYKLYPHQKRAIWRVIQTGNVYLAHAVGAGKTLEMIVSGMEQRRLGLINRPMYVVPNHMLNQFASEFLEAYPLAQILVADEKNFDKKNRRRFIAQATLNNPDAIIITHSGFGKLGTKPETAEAAMQGFIDQLEAAIEDSSDKYSRSKLEKRLEQAKRKIEARFEKDKDDMLFFEETGVDFLFVDEAHEFRKLDFVTNRNNVKGITPEGSQKALDLYSKLQWLSEQHPGRSHVLASGTPVTNTMGELYSLLRYMDPASLEKDGLTTFDAWATMYGQVSAALEQNAAGTYETVERFSKFVNVPELMKRVRSFMDVLTMSQLGDLVKRPDLNGGTPANVVAKPSEALNEYLKGELAARIERSRKWKPSRAQPHNPDPMINIITDGRLAAIDLRFVNPEAENDPDSKLNLMIDDIIKTHKAIADRTYKGEETGRADPIKGGTQIVFSSVGFGEQVSKNRGFDLRYHVMKRFKDAGIPASQVAWMSDYTTHAKKEAMFNDMRAGKVRILIGSPKNMGTGVNVQKRLCKLHFLSAPWYPADVEQPHGRILRQGNQNPSVDINWYATKGTYDSTAWGMVARKARFIEQAFTGDDTVRVLDDISESSQYEMAAALAAGDERAIQLAGYNADIERLSRLQRAHSEEQYSFRSRQRSIQRRLEELGKDKGLLEEAIRLRGKERISSDNFSATIADKQYSKLKEASEAILKRIAELSGEWKPTAFGAKKKISLGSIHNNECKLFAQLESSQRDEHNNLKTIVRSYTLKIGQAEFLLPEDTDQETSAQGLATRLVNKLNSLEKLLADNQQAEKNLREESRKLESRIGVPFPNEAELNEKIAEAARLREELEAEGRKDKEGAAQEQSNGESEDNDSDSLASLNPGQYLPERRTAKRITLSASAVRKVADELGGRAKNAAGVEVAQTFWDLPLNLQNKFSTNVNTLEGVFDPNTGKVWLVADNLESTARAAEVWAHEQIVHNGLRGMLTESERRNMLNQLWLSMDGMSNQLIKRIAEAYGLNPRGNLADRLLVMEETLANLAERRQAGLLTPQQESMWRKIVRAIARVWNAVIERVTGRHASMGMEQVDNLLAALGGYVMDGVPANGQLTGEAAASLSENGGDTNSYGVPMERVTKISGNITKTELQNALRKLAGIDLENYIENITAQVNRNQSEKMMSAVAIKKSIDNGFTYKEHYGLASQIANAWKWAADTNIAGSKNNVGDVKVGRFVSPLMVNGQDVFAWITTKATQDGLRIYSIELLNEKTLRGVLGNDTETSSPHPSRSIEDIIARLKGPVNQANVPLAALNLRQILNMGSKQAVNAAQAPEIRHFFRENDLTLMQSILQLPHWLAKQQPKFAQIYERQIRRKDERAEAVTKSLREVPSLFGKGQLSKSDMESLKKLIWEIEGEKFDFENATKKFLSDGEFANGRKKLKVNQQFYDEYIKVIDGLQATEAAKKAMLEIRKSLDNDLCLAYNRMASMGEVTDDAITQFRDRINHISNYFPHHRYGRYFIQAKKAGEVVFRQHFDALNKAMAKRKAREIAQEQMQNYPDSEWIDGENAKLPDEILGAPIDAEAMEQIIKSATSKIGDKEQAEKINTLLCQGVADVLKTRGWSEHAIGRKGVPGFEMDDVVKVLYDYKSGLHGWLTKMEAAKDFSRALADIDARQNPKLWKYASQYIKDMLRNSDGIDRMTGNIKAVAFAWYLGANLKTAVVNATQNIIVGVPRLQMDVSGGAHLWLKGAMDAIVNRVTGNKGSNLTADEAKLIQELYEQDVITDAFMTEVRGHMGGVSGAGLFNKFTRILGWPMSEVERFNRTSLALAAFRAVMQGKLKQSAKDKYGITGKPSYEQAKQFAAEVVRDAHFVYGKTNMPEFMRSNTTGRAVGSAYTFRTFSHNMLNMWLWALKTQGKDGAAFTAKSIGSTMVLGGVTALPLYATLMALFQAVTGDDDDWTEEIRKALPDNNLLRDVVCYGAPAFTGFNIGGSLKMETPMTKGVRKGSNPKEVLTESIGDIIGIPYDLIVAKPTNVTKALDAGNYWRAIEELVPTFVKNGMQAWRLHDEGQTTMKGVPINTPGKPGARKLTEAEAIGKLLGFQPVSSTKSFEAYQAQLRRDEVRSNKIDEIVLKVLRAQDTGDMKHQRDGIKEMERWNERMKKEGKPGMMFNFKDVMRRVKRRRSGNKPSPKQLQKGRSQIAVWGV